MALSTADVLDVKSRELFVSIRACGYLSFLINLMAPHNAGLVTSNDGNERVKQPPYLVSFIANERNIRKLNGMRLWQLGYIF